MIGAASTLASIFRAPLTASLLLFEQTRGYDIVLPLLAAAGTGPLVAEYASRSLAAARRVEECDVEEVEMCVEESRLRAVEEECDIDNRIVCNPEDEGAP